MTSYLTTKFNLCPLVSMAMTCIIGVFTASAGGDVVSDFKDFVQSPPQIHEVQFSITDCAEYFGSSGDTVKHYQGRWQSNGFFLRQLADSDSVSDLRIPTKGVFFTQYENRYCYYSPDGTFRFWHDNGKDPKDKSTPPYYLTECTGKAILGLVLNMGIIPAQIKSVKWSGLTFTAPPGCSSYSTEGKIVVESGLPIELGFQYEYNGRTIKWLVRYDYSRKLDNAPFLASKISVFQKRDPNLLIPIKKISIHSLQFSETRSEYSLFSPDSFVAATLKGNTGKMLVYTNRQLSAISQNGRYLIPMASLPSGAPVQARRDIWPLVFWPAVIITTTGFFLILRRMREIQKGTNTK